MASQATWRKSVLREIGEGAVGGAIEAVDREIEFRVIPVAALVLRV